MGHAWTQVFYLQLTGSTITVNDLQSIANEINSLWATNIAPRVTPDVINTHVSIVYIPSVGNEVTYEGTYTTVGTAAGTTVSDASAAYVINWAISAYYRGGHPRSYLPGVETSAVTNGSAISPTAASGLAGAWNTFRNGLNAFTTTNVTAIVMGTLSFQTGNAWRTTPLFRPFTSVSVRSVLGSQRRRILS